MASETETLLPRNGRSTLGRVWQISLGVALIGGIAGGALYWGYRAHAKDLFPEYWLAKVDRKVDQFVDKVAPEPTVSDTSLVTTLVKLEMDVAYVDTGRNVTLDPMQQNGGGLASFGEDAILLPYTGEIFAASSSATIRKTKISAPDNGRADFIATAEDPAFSDYNFIKGYLRYNDIEAYDSAVGRGLIASYTEWHQDELCYTNTLARLEIDRNVVSIDEVSAEPDDWQVFYRSEPCLPLKKQHVALEGHIAGGKMVFEAPSTIYMTAGDYHIDELRSKGMGVLAQEDDNHYGKILAIDLVTGDHEVLTKGHRNPQGITQTPDGRIWSVEHGPKGGDELNLIERGKNYGWPLETYGVTYRTGTQVPGTISYGRHEQYEPPKYAWLPSIATSGIIYVGEGFHRTWDGDFLVASLIDKSINRVRMDQDNGVYSERIEIGSRIRDLMQHSDGRVVLWTDSKEMIFLRAEDRTSVKPLFDRYVRDAAVDEIMAAKLDTAVSGCAECHSLEVNEHDKSPSLARIHNDPQGATSYAGYSSALAGMSGRWTSAELKEFLSDTDRYAPGTGMPTPELAPEVVDHVIGFLAALDQAF